MSALVNAASLLTQSVLATQDQITATASSTGVDISDYEGSVSVYFHAPHVEGTPTSVTVTIEHSNVLGSGYTTVSTLTAFTASGYSQKVVLDTNALGRYLRITTTIVGGSSPKVSCVAVLTGAKKVQ